MSKKEILNTEEKQTLKGYAEFCLKCGKEFKERDIFLGALYCNFLDRPGDWERKNVINNYTCTEYICTASRGKIREALCYECFNKYIENGTIVYDGYANIYTPEDFFRVTYLAEKQQEMEVDNNPQVIDLVKRYWDWATEDLLQATTIDRNNYRHESNRLMVMELERRNYLQSVREIFLTEYKKSDEEILSDEENLENLVNSKMLNIKSKEVHWSAILFGLMGLLLQISAILSFFSDSMKIDFIIKGLFGFLLLYIGYKIHRKKIKRRILEN